MQSLSGSLLLVLLLAAVYALLELSCYLGLDILHDRTGLYYSPRSQPRLTARGVAFIERLLAENGKGKTIEYSPILGWTTRALAQVDGVREINSRGVRDEREFAERAAPERIRIATFGDCLTYGSGVPPTGTWQRRMEALEPRFEVMNFGVEGYGPDQMLLRHRQSLEHYGDQRIVVLSLVSSNVFKSLNAFRPFFAFDHGLQLGKPRFELRDGRLDEIPNPMGTLEDYRELLRDPKRRLAHLGALDPYYAATYHCSALDRLASVRLAKILHNEFRKRRRVVDWRGRLLSGSDALATTLAVVERFRKEVRSRGGELIVLFLPLKREIRRFLRSGVRPFTAVIDEFEAHGHPYVDVLDAMATHRPGVSADDFFHDQHYAPHGHELIAETLVEALRALLPSVLEPSRNPRAGTVSHHSG